jgi:hypothetical protein
MKIKNYINSKFCVFSIFPFIYYKLKYKIKNYSLNQQRIINENLSSFSYSNNHPKLLILNSDIPNCQLINNKSLPNDIEIYKIQSDLQNSSKIQNILNYYCNNSYNNENINKIDLFKNNLNIAINSYGDIKILDDNKLRKDEKNFSIFERLNILTNIDKILFMKHYNFYFIYKSNEKKDNIIYNSNNFIMFRYLFRKLYKFLNLKFYVMIDDYKINELNLKENNFFCIQRKNFLNENFDKKTEFKINNQTFFITNLTNEFNIKNYKNNFLKILTNKLNMFYFIQNENNITKNIIENLNLLLKKKNYIYIQSNFYYQKNQIKKFYEELKKNNLNSLIILNHNYNYKQNDIEIIQTFKDKYFNLKEYTLKNVNMNNINEYYKYFSYNILKKKFLDINNLKFYNDIKFEENSLFSKKI